MGYGKAHEMIMTGDMVPAEEAHRIGMVNHVVRPEDLNPPFLTWPAESGASPHTHWP